VTTTTVVVRHVNIGLARRLKVGERSVLTAIGKAPITGPVAVGPLGLAGDEQADPSVHGGLGKAIYAYPAAHYAFWQAQRRERGVSLFDDTLPPGSMGENLTIDGPLENDVYVGDEWHFPHCVLRVSAPREPCFKFKPSWGLRRRAAPWPWPGAAATTWRWTSPAPSPPETPPRWCPGSAG
jgi:MOSC domain-containing protein YiiM